MSIVVGHCEIIEDSKLHFGYFIVLRWITVVVDDQFPCIQIEGKPIQSHLRELDSSLSSSFYLQLLWVSVIWACT
jgi:hypothetical protein